MTPLRHSYRQVPTLHDDRQRAGSFFRVLVGSLLPTGKVRGQPLITVKPTVSRPALAVRAVPVSFGCGGVGLSAVRTGNCPLNAIKC